MGCCVLVRGRKEAAVSFEASCMHRRPKRLVFFPFRLHRLFSHPYTHNLRTYTGIDKEQAEREVDEYLADKDAYIAKARAEEAKQAKKK